jgi:hypothetical protein
MLQLHKLAQYPSPVYLQQRILLGILRNKQCFYHEKEKSQVGSSCIFVTAAIFTFLIIQPKAHSDINRYATDQCISTKFNHPRMPLLGMTTVIIIL